MPPAEAEPLLSYARDAELVRDAAQRLG
jgi:hypothetical protein